MLPEGNIGKIGDLVLYSPHKHLPIPNGALLVIRDDGPAKLDLGNKIETSSG